MDLANYSKSLSNMVTQEIIRDCNISCFKEESGVPDRDCVNNCVGKSASFLAHFNKVIRTEIPKLQEISRIH